MDECMNCTVRGDIDACMKTPCSQHESWYAQTLKAQQRTWVGLTEQDKEDTMEWLGHDVSSQVFYAIEAKLKEKNT